MSDEIKVPEGETTAPTLVFDESAAPSANMTGITQIQQELAGIDDKNAPELTPDELKQVDAFANQIDLTNTSGIMNYGAGTQKNLASFSEAALESVRTKEMGEIGSMLAGLVTELKNFDVDTKDKGFLAFLKKKKNALDELKARYSKIETNVDRVSTELERHERQLMKDSELLDRMYAMNVTYYKELTMYIAAGKKKLAEVRANELPAAQKKAQETGRQEDAQAAQDLAAQCERFDKKLYDLELTRTISLQTAPQIRLIQGTDMQMAEKIQSTIVNTIPLWKNQMVIAVGMEHAAQAAKAEREVNDMTNDLLKKNADKLHQVTVDAAKENERGIVDIETLQHTNEQLIAAIDDIMTIQKDGREKRAAAEKELGSIEQELRTKLLEASKA